MVKTKIFNNGLRLIVSEMEGFKSVTAGVLVKTGSINETEKENGISHFIEHNLFKGTKKRSSYEISDFIDRIGAQINAFTSKEITCYYTKSLNDRLEDSLEVLSDIFFNSVFDKEEMEKEKGVVIEEINMSEDTPEDICLDLLAQSYYGNEGLGRTILGPAKNIRRFTKADIQSYMDKYYTADNVVISIAGKVKFNDAVNLVEKYFANNFKVIKSAKQYQTKEVFSKKAYKSKKIEQAHIGFCFPSFSYSDKDINTLSIANTIFGGGMSSRLFQKIREELGLAYSVYSYPSHYKNSGVVEIYAGVNIDMRDTAAQAIYDEIKRFAKEKISEQEFVRGKEQIKSAFVMGGENTAVEMRLQGKYMLFMKDFFDVEKELKFIDGITINDVNGVIDRVFDTDQITSVTVGPSKRALKYN